VLDDTDANWWKGSNQRGEGLFPANFVTPDLNVHTSDPSHESPSGNRKVQFKDAVEVRTVEPVDVDDDEEDEDDDTESIAKAEIDENKIRQTLKMIHEADPTGQRMDPQELTAAEGETLCPILFLVIFQGILEILFPAFGLIFPEKRGIVLILWGHIYNKSQLFPN
jgi:signal transducing adaptor molecule